MNIYSIYKATNKHQPWKHYIGEDSCWPKRMQDHFYSSFNKNNKSYWYELHKAIRFFGKDAFEWSVLYQSYDRDHCLKIMEPYFIKEYNSYYKWDNGGYNMTLGGEGNKGIKFTEEHKINLSISHIGHKQKQETKNKISVYMSKYPNLGMKGKNHTEQTKDIMAKNIQNVG